MIPISCMLLVLTIVAGSAVMNEEEEEEEENSEAEEESTAAASRISLNHSDISGESDIERDEEEEEEEEDFDDSLQEPGSSNGRDASKHQQSEPEGTAKSRKRKRGADEACSSRHMCAAEDKHIKESKLKHNKNEQLR